MGRANWLDVGPADGSITDHHCVEMLPENRIPVHPGEMLLTEFLEPLNLTQKALADHIGVPLQRVNEIVRGRRGVSPATAWLFAKALATTPNFWMNLQVLHDQGACRA